MARIKEAPATGSVIGSSSVFRCQRRKCLPIHPVAALKVSQRVRNTVLLQQLLVFVDHFSVPELISRAVDDRQLDVAEELSSLIQIGVGREQ